MALITKQDTNGVKGLLAKGELGLDDTGLDPGRVYVGDGTDNIPMAKKSDLDTKADISANLSDLADAKDARQNLGLGTAATRDVGTSNGQVPEFVSNGEGLGGFGYGRVGTSEGKYTDVNDVPKRTGFYLLTEGHPNSTNNKAPAAGFYDTCIVRTLRQGTNEFVDVYLPHPSYSPGMVIAPHTSNGYETQRIVSDSVNLRTTTGNSTIYPMSQKAVTDALNTKVSLTGDQTIEGVKTFESPIVGSTTTQVSLTGNQSIAGTKTFTSFPVTPSAAPTDDYQAANKKYVDDRFAEVELSNPDSTYLKWVTYNGAEDTYSGNIGVTPVHEAMRRCVVDSNSNVVYYLNEYDSTLKEDGTPANLDGTDGDVMVEIPQVWYKTEFNGHMRTDYVSHKARPGFTLHPRFRGGAVEKIYVGAYDASVFDVSAGAYIDGLNLDNNLSRVDVANDKLASVSGRFPMVGLKRSDFRSIANNAGGFLEMWYEWQLLKLLFVVEYGNWNSQAVLGRGNVDRSYVNSSSVQSQSPHVAAGWSNGLGNQSGGINDADGTPYVSYRGIENLWGNCWTFIDGINILDRVCYVSADPSVFADGTTTGYTAVGTAMPTADEAYIKTWQKVDGVYIPATIGGSTSTFIGDGLWTNTGWRTATVGGNAADALLSGLGALVGSNGAAGLNRRRGSRLSREKLML